MTPEDRQVIREIFREEAQAMIRALKGSDTLTLSDMARNLDVSTQTVRRGLKAAKRYKDFGKYSPDDLRAVDEYRKRPKKRYCYKKRSAKPKN